MSRPRRPGCATAIGYAALAGLAIAVGADARVVEVLERHLPEALAIGFLAVGLLLLLVDGPSRGDGW